MQRCVPETSERNTSSRVGRLLLPTFRRRLRYSEAGFRLPVGWRLIYICSRTQATAPPSAYWWQSVGEGRTKFELPLRRSKSRFRGLPATAMGAAGAQNLHRYGTIRLRNSYCEGGANRGTKAQASRQRGWLNRPGRARLRWLWCHFWRRSIPAARCGPDYKKTRAAPRRRQGECVAGF